jgi:hypothetical protein
MDLDLGVLEEGKATEEEDIERRTEELLGKTREGERAGIKELQDGEGEGDAEEEDDDDNVDDDDDVQFEEDV